MSKARPTIPEKCQGPCGRPLRGSHDPVTPGTTRHYHSGLCKPCGSVAAPERGPQDARGTTEEHRRGLAAYIQDRRARGVPVEGYPEYELIMRRRNNV